MHPITYVWDIRRSVQSTDNSVLPWSYGHRRGRETWHWHAPHVLTYPITGNVRESRRDRIPVRLLGNSEKIRLASLHM